MVGRFFKMATNYCVSNIDLSMLDNRLEIITRTHIMENLNNNYEK